MFRLTFLVNFQYNKNKLNNEIQGTKCIRILIERVKFEEGRHNYGNISR